MIIIQNWIANIPEQDKHLAYVGEHQAIKRQFLLTGEDWREYTDWGFHLDMAFDLSTVTTRDLRQVETSKVNATENVSDVQVSTTSTTTKEKYTVEEVDVDCWSKEDIASLAKEITEEGILLTWTVLRQHTQLPGRLKANIRALGNDGQVKKTAMMVFDVAPSVHAEAAADLPQSEFEAMEEHMDEMLDAVLKNAQMVEFYLEDVQNAKSDAIKAANRAENVKITWEDDIATLQGQVDIANSSIASLYPVRFCPQTLTADQKRQVWDNIGLTVDDALNLHSTNPVANLAVTDYISKLETRMGSVDKALDRILAIQQTLMGGGSV